MNTITPARRRAYRRRHQKELGKNGKTALLIILIAFILFIVAILLGNYLGGLAQETDGSLLSSAPVPATSERSRGSLSDIPLIIAKAVPLYTSGYVTPAAPAADGTEAPVTEPAAAQDTSVEETVLPEEPAELISYNALSVLLRTGDGILYSSPVSKNYSADPGLPDINECLAELKRDFGEQYISGVFALTWQNVPADTRALTREYEMTLLCELFGAGFDDIVLYGFGSDAEAIDEALSFADELHDRTGGMVGLALDFDFFSGTEAADRIRDLRLNGVFLAMDLWSVGIPGLMTPETLIYDRTERVADVLSANRVRVLLGCGSQPVEDAQAAAAMRAGAYNIQSVRLFTISG